MVTVTCVCVLFSHLTLSKPRQKKKNDSRTLVLPEQRAQHNDGLYTLYCIVVLLVT